MKAIITSLTLGVLCVGCAGTVPKLHLPDLAASKTSSTNRFERVKPNTNDNVYAYIQISSDKDVAEEFGSTFADCFYVGEVMIENRNTNTFLAYGASLDVNVAYYVAEEDWMKRAELRKLMTNRFDKEYILSHRRPATYSDIIAIFEYQRRANWKQQTVDYMKSGEEIAAGATVFVGGEMYAKAVAFTTGIVTTEVEKHLLWDILLHAKNLEARSLKDIEEVPPLSSVHRLVFFPKRGISGILDGFEVYISSFSDQMARTREPVLISGAMITKNKAATSGSVDSN